MKIRYRTLSGEIKETKIPKPENLRDGTQDCLEDYASDCLQELGIRYKWFRILK
ncbi:hypothetical protein [Kaistella sp.]|uniref:hypothetical protein n=1 Tax=Kaistella sp. TaxID=2782235 RepID=UPI002F9532F8